LGKGGGDAEARRDERADEGEEFGAELGSEEAEVSDLDETFREDVEEEAVPVCRARHRQG
jgi:hypothetical protein